LIITNSKFTLSKNQLVSPIFIYSSWYERFKKQFRVFYVLYRDDEIERVDHMIRSFAAGRCLVDAFLPLWITSFCQQNPEYEKNTTCKTIFSNRASTSVFACCVFLMFKRLLKADSCHMELVSSMFRFLFRPNMNDA